MKNGLGKLAAGLGLLLAVFVAYGPVRDAGFIWDDDAYVENNRTLRDGEGLTKIWIDPTATPQYYPLVHTSYWIEFQLTGLDPSTYHLTNVFLHAISALLLWWLLSKLRVPGAFLAAALFAVHPVHVESVAWITERKNVLSGVFYFAAFLAWWRFRADDEGRLFVDGRRRWPMYALALPLFAAALLAKSVTCTLPCVAWLVVWWKSGRIGKRDWLELAPFLWIGALQGLLTARLEKTHVLAVGPEWAFSLGDRFIIAGRAVWFYLEKLFWPDPLIFSYPRWAIDSTSLLQWAAPILAGLTALLLWRIRNHWGRGPLVAWLAFVGTLFPALGFINVYPMRYSFVADHFQYLASVPVLALVAAGVARLSVMSVSRDEGRFSPRRALYPLVVIAVIAGFGKLSFEQSKIYESREVLWRDTLTKNPGSGMAHNNLGILLFRRGEFEEAMTHFRSALSFGQNLPEIRTHISMCLNRLGRFEEAEEEIVKARALKPDSAFVREAHARIKLASGDQREALRLVDEALAADEEYALGWSTRGAILLNLERHAEALVSFDQAIELDPGSVAAWNGRGLVLSFLNDQEGAMSAFRRAQQLSPESIEIAVNLAGAMRNSERAEEALRVLEALGESPVLRAERTLLEANLRLELGEADRAISLFARAGAPTAPPALRPAAWRGLVLAYSVAFRHEEARQGAARLRQALPGVESWIVTAKVELAANRDAAAADAYRQAAAAARAVGRVIEAEEFEARAAELSPR